MMPVEWFMTGPMKNFMEACVAAGMDKESVKAEFMRALEKM
jgi:hypothetical protein